MFVVNAGFGVSVEFDRYQNGRWRLTAVKDTERREIFRSVSNDEALLASAMLINMPDEETDAKRFAKKFKHKFAKSLKNKL